MKLPREQHDCRHGHEQHGEGGGVARVAFGPAQGEQSREEFGPHGVKTGKDVAEAVEEIVGHKQAYAENADQLDHRFEGYGGHQPLVAFRRRQPAGAENHAEHGQDQGQQ
jgi:hypothetical protein